MTYTSDEQALSKWRGDELAGLASLPDSTVEAVLDRADDDTVATLSGALAAIDMGYGELQGLGALPGLPRGAEMARRLRPLAARAAARRRQRNAAAGKPAPKPKTLDQVQQAAQARQVTGKPRLSSPAPAAMPAARPGPVLATAFARPMTWRTSSSQPSPWSTRHRGGGLSGYVPTDDPATSALEGLAGLGFIKKLVKRVGKGIKKVGKVVRRNVNTITAAAGAVFPAAAPIVGTALSVATGKKVKADAMKPGQSLVKLAQTNALKEAQRFVGPTGPRGLVPQDFGTDAPFDPGRMPQQQQPAAKSTTPPWLLPAAVAALGLVVLSR